jgi:hypothetical protein
MTRLFATGLLLWAISPGLPAAAQSAVAPLMEEPLIEGLYVRVSNRPEGVGVDIGADRARRSQAPQAFGETTVHVWVLKSDGTALPRKRLGQPIRVSNINLRNGQAELRSLLFDFEPADARDLDAVVVSLDGVLFVRPIPRTPTN